METQKKGSVRKILLSLGMMAVTVMLLTVMLIVAVTPVRYDLKTGMVSPVTITATKDVIDTVTTQQRRDTAAKQVELSYVADATVAKDVIADLESAFAAFTSLGYESGDEAPSGDIPQDILDGAAEIIAPAEMSDARMQAVLMTDRTTLSSLAAQAEARVRQHLTLNVAEGQESSTVYEIQRELVSLGWNTSLAGAAADMIRPYLRANMLIDDNATEANRQAARDAVENVVYIKGQNIVRSGEVVTYSQIEMLNSLGLLQEQGTDVYLIVGVGVTSLMLVVLLGLYLFEFERSMLFEPSQVLLLMVILLLTVAACFGISKINVYLMPAALGTMLTCYLIKPRLALMMCLVLAVPTALIASGASGTFTVTVFLSILNCVASGSLGIVIVHNRSDRTGVVLAGLGCAAICVVMSIATGLINNADFNSVLINSCWAGASGILSGLLCVGLQPVIENLFNLPTRARLNELANPNRPLMRRLLLEAPGTYHHSIMVANLAEAAANVVGANGVLCRVGAYYHDVGKLKRPLYFSENQMGDNPHDRTDPRVSAAIILAHPHDGVNLALKERMPKAVCDIIATHHGRTTVAYFLDRAIKRSGEENVNRDEFTYDAPLPSTREEAIVMLADPVEAAARALPNKDPQALEELIIKLTDARMRNGDLDNCKLTLHDIGLIRKSFMTVLMGMYHERVEYPEDNKSKKGRQPIIQLFGKGHQESANANDAGKTGTAARTAANAPVKQAAQTAADENAAGASQADANTQKVSADANRAEPQTKTSERAEDRARPVQSEPSAAEKKPVSEADAYEKPAVNTENSDKQARSLNDASEPKPAGVEPDNGGADDDN